MLQRIVVIGTTSSGKTTLAQQLSELLDIPHVELDALHWGPNWTAAELDVFRERADQALRGERWVVDGNYSRLREIVWGRADTVIWLDYHLYINLWRLFSRTIRRIVNREQLWHENRESWRAFFFSQDSLLWWLLQSHGRNRRRFPEAFRQPEHAHLQVVQLRSPRETAAWLARLRLEQGRDRGPEIG